MLRLPHCSSGLRKLDDPMPPSEGHKWQRWQRTTMMLAVTLLLIAHVTALIVGGYPEWPVWAAGANFAGLALFVVALVLSRVTRR